MKTAGQWTVRLTNHARSDYQKIIRWTADRFGEHQAKVYARVLSDAIRALTGGPDIHNTRPRNDIRTDVHTLHVARHGNRGSHLLVFRCTPGRSNTIEILRILHDSMDLTRHSLD